ncbi:hypothetical protein [Mycobacteroides abscessus]|uniref:hypothetical protein n=1 Tax=Mycobacteroides abscessus TaxID=36809 RepID=UPI0009A5D093|nr:hypothetical protein [Mycobacteroides abscessus]
MDWESLDRVDTRRAKRALLIMHIGDRAVQANSFLEWGLRPHLIDPDSRLAHDDAAVSFTEDEPNIISSTARYPAMNACDNLVGAAQVVSLAITQGQLRTSAATILCRTAMESAAKTIWLIHPTDTEERLRRSFGFIETERSWQNHFNQIEEEVLKARTDKFASADRTLFDTRRAKFETKLELITNLREEQRQRPPKNVLELVKGAEKWVDAENPRQPDPELDKIKVPRGAESFYSLGSGFVHGYKWLIDYIDPDSPAQAECDLLEITVDAFIAALRMTECAVALFEAQAIGQKRSPRRTSNYPNGIQELVERWYALYRPTAYPAADNRHYGD